MEAVIHFLTKIITYTEGCEVIGGIPLYSLTPPPPLQVARPVPKSPTGQALDYVRLLMGVCMGLKQLLWC